MTTCHTARKQCPRCRRWKLKIAFGWLVTRRDTYYSDCRRVLNREAQERYRERGREIGAAVAANLAARDRPPHGAPRPLVHPPRPEDDHLSGERRK